MQEMYSEGRGKPPAMPAEVFDDCCGKIVDALQVLDGAECVREVDTDVRGTGEVVVSLKIRPVGTAQVIDRLRYDLGFEEVASIDWGTHSRNGSPVVRVVEIALVASVV